MVFYKTKNNGTVRVDGGSNDEDKVSVQTVAFTEVSTRSNIQSGESFSTIFGKIKKFFTDLKTVAFTGSYNDLSDKPTAASIGAAAGSHTHNYNDLTNKPSIPTAVAVKGNAETNYRTGNVNLTAANIGAAASNHSHSYLPLSGGLMNGGAAISWPGVNGKTPMFNMLTTSSDTNQAFMQIYPKGWYTVDDLSSLLVIGIASDDHVPEIRSWWDNQYNIGRSNYRFKAVYAATGTIQTSDREKKKNIKEFDDKFIEDFIMGIIPVSYILKDGESGRTHYGIIAQDIEDLMSKLGINSKDFAGFIKSPKYKSIVREVEDENGIHYEPSGEILVEGEYDYSLRYEEFISPMIKMIQILKNRVDNQQKEIENLKAEIWELKS